MAQADIIIGADAGLKTVMERVNTVAGSDLPVLLYGETGTGKEVISLAIHERSGRKGSVFKRVNCGAISPELVDSELFGHERGSFTGSAGSRRGWFEQADGGTLFLDEVAELTLSGQVRLLRVLQEGEFTRVGGERPLKVDVRIVAATHRDLPEMIKAGTFREDLYYRLAVFPIVIPPLRDRPADFEALTHYFTHRASTRFGLMPVVPSARDIELLAAYPWPGNVREFAAVIDRAVLLGEGRTLAVEAALGFSPSARPAEQSDLLPLPSSAEILPLDEVVRQHIERALAAANGRVEGLFGAARKLALNPNTLRSKMRKLGIDPKAFRYLEE